MKSVLASLALFAAAAVPASAADLVTNGNFEATNLQGSSQVGQRFPSGQVAGWDIGGYVYLYFPGTADTGGAPGEYGPGTQAYGPNNGFNNGLTATSPVGGNFLMLDGDTSPHLRGSISQTVSGLTVGDDYIVSFYLAGAQQLNFPGATFDKYFDVTFGAETQRSDVLGGPEASFQPWRQNAMRFTATSGSQVLSFLAHGQPTGLPPFLFLDGVAVNAAVPEPATWAMLIIGFGLVGAAARRRATQARASA